MELLLHWYHCDALLYSDVYRVGGDIIFILPVAAPDIEDELSLSLHAISFKITLHFLNHFVVKVKAEPIIGLLYVLFLDLTRLKLH